jgi:hypothetical protein
MIQHQTGSVKEKRKRALLVAMMIAPEYLAGCKFDVLLAYILSEFYPSNIPCNLQNYMSRLL